jgi:nitrate reductase NapAB chaperone NapD
MPAHVAGLLVVVHPDCLDAVAHRIGESPGAEVHLREHQTGRLVVTVDTPTLPEQEARFKAIANIPGVCAVDLVCHYVDPGDAEPRRAPMALGHGERP